MKSFRRRLSAIVSHPLLQILIGLTMMVCGLAEVLSDMGEVVAGELTASGAHGVVLFGALHAVKSLLELVETLEGFEEAEVLHEVEKRLDRADDAA